MRIAIDGAGFPAGRSRADCAAPWRRSSASATIEAFREEVSRRAWQSAATRESSRRIAGSRSKASADTDFPKATPRALPIWSMRRPGSNAITPTCSLAALLNSQPMGFYATSQLVRDAQEHGVEVRPVDVNRSNWDCTLEAGRDREARLHPRHASMSGDILTTHAVRLGFRQIDGFSEDWGKKIESVRGRGFDSVRDLWLRTGLPPKALQNARPRRCLQFARAQPPRCALGREGASEAPATRTTCRCSRASPCRRLSPMRICRRCSPGEQVIEDYRHLHLSLKAHPVSFLRARFRRARHRASRIACPRSRRAGASPSAGIVLVRQRPGTGNAIFMTLEDETGDRQHHRLAAQVRAVSPCGDGRAADQRDRRAAEREGRHPHRRRPFRGSDAVCWAGCRSTARRIDTIMPAG